MQIKDLSIPHHRRGQAPPAVRLAFAVALLAMPYVVPTGATGEIYHYVQPDGTIAFTNVPTDARYRKLADRTTSIRPKVSGASLDRAIARHSRQHDLSPALLRAIIKAESNFDPAAVSRAGAVGLMQLMPETAVKLDVRDPYDPDENIGGGARYLRYLLDRFNGNLPLALAAYNAGERRVEQYQTLPPIKETRRYVFKVLRYYRAFIHSEAPLAVRGSGGLISPTPARSVAYRPIPHP
jgi:soluble lytic murein transglycosylase